MTWNDGHNSTCLSRCAVQAGWGPAGRHCFRYGLGFVRPCESPSPQLAELMCSQGGGTAQDGGVSFGTTLELLFLKEWAWRSLVFFGVQVYCWVLLSLVEDDPGEDVLVMVIPWALPGRGVLDRIPQCVSLSAFILLNSFLAIADYPARWIYLCFYGFTV